MELVAAATVLHFLLGVLLGLRFRVHVLIPAFAFVGVEAVAAFLLGSLALAAWIAFGAILFIQLGYLAGVAWRAFAVRGQHHSSKPGWRLRRLKGSRDKA